MEIKAAVLYGVGEKLKVEPLDLAPPAGMSDSAQRRLLDRLTARNREHQAGRADNSATSGSVASITPGSGPTDSGVGRIVVSIRSGS